MMKILPLSTLRNKRRPKNVAVGNTVKNNKDEKYIMNTYNIDWSTVLSIEKEKN